MQLKISFLDKKILCNKKNGFQNFTSCFRKNFKVIRDTSAISSITMAVEMANFKSPMDIFKI